MKIIKINEIDEFIKNVYTSANVLSNQYLNCKNLTYKSNIKLFYDELSFMYEKSMKYKGVDFEKMSEVFKRKRMLKELNFLINQYMALINYLNKNGIPRAQVLEIRYKDNIFTKEPDDLILEVVDYQQELLRRNSEVVDSLMRSR